MKWNGIVSHRGNAVMTKKFTTAKTAQAVSSHLRRRNPITRMADRLDRSVRAELLAQAADTDVDDVGTRIEVVAPHLRQEALAAHDLAGMLDEVPEQLELPRRQVGDLLAEVRAPGGEVEREPTRMHDVLLVRRPVPLQLDAHAREQLLERERLREVVRRPKLEAAELRREIRARRQDEHRQLGPELVQRA